MILMLDIGNTRVKWAYLDDGRISIGGGISHHDRSLTALWTALWDSLCTPERIVVASVASTDVETSLAAWTESRWAMQPEFMHAVGEDCGVRNGYLRPGQLGVDRWMALIGARQLTAVSGLPLCVIGCGTALTIDVISGEGSHLGGWIAPGLHMMRQSLRSGTAAIDVADEFEGGVDKFGSCTEHAVGAGVLNAAAGLVKQSLLLAQQLIGETPTCVVTGGDAGALLPLLPRTTVVAENLVLHGLAVTVLRQEPA